ncbi:hypothetical protein [Pseudoalteromonas sp. T1lg21]|uniref:hypothetical protein n=1 Tax=Pseudoalteromonas sp. T1lg21 TaxID=2077095 RepID=UPI000CF69376|nr:hypothetical protein [Pseudoalteromonas sp. T1lg21]
MPIFDFENEYDKLLTFIKSNDFYFENVTFLESFDFIPNNIEQNLTFKNCSFKTKELDLGDEEQISSEFKGKDIYFDSCVLRSVRFRDLSKINDVTFTSSKIIELSIGYGSKLPSTLDVVGNTTVNTLRIFDTHLNTKITFRLDRLDYLEISRVHNSDFLSIVSYTGARILYIEEFLNFDYFEMDGMENKSKLSGRFYMGHNSFGNARFSQSNFSSYNRFTYLNNDISELSCTDSEWKSKNLNMTDSEILEYFRDIKNLLTYGSAEYQKFNMSFLDNLFKFSNYQDKMILTFSKLISNHCTNWLLPIIWLFVINILIIYFMNLSLPNKLVTFQDTTVLLNPLHLNRHYSLWIELESQITNQFVVLDIVARALNAAILYHLVKTFRRFHTS